MKPLGISSAVQAVYGEYLPHLVGWVDLSVGMGLTSCHMGNLGTYPGAKKEKKDVKAKIGARE